MSYVGVKHEFRLKNVRMLELHVRWFFGSLRPLRGWFEIGNMLLGVLRRGLCSLPRVELVVP